LHESDIDALLHDRLKEIPEDRRIPKASVTILRKRRVIGNRLIKPQACKPPVRKVQSDFVEQAPSFVLLCLAAAHIYYAAGGQLGQQAILGDSADPGPVAKLVVAALLVVGSSIVAVRVNLLRLPIGERLIRVVLYVMVGAFVAVALDNAFSRTMLERAAFAPMALILAVATLTLAIYRSPARPARG